MPTELKEINDLLFEVLEECSDNHQLKFDIHQKFNRRLDFNFNKKPIYSEQEVQTIKKELDVTKTLYEEIKGDCRLFREEVQAKDKEIQELKLIIKEQDELNKKILRENSELSIFKPDLIDKLRLEIREQEKRYTELGLSLGKCAKEKRELQKENEELRNDCKGYQDIIRELKGDD